jgi:hypothetical protein
MVLICEQNFCNTPRRCNLEICAQPRLQACVVLSKINKLHE